MLCQEDKEQVRGDKEQAWEQTGAAEDRTQDGAPGQASAVPAEIVFAQNVAIRRCTKGGRNAI